MPISSWQPTAACPMSCSVACSLACSTLPTIVVSAKATDYHYSEPDEPHPAGTIAMQRKIHQARREAGDTSVYALAHGYGPPEDFRRRLAAAWQASPAGVWVNRYGYLSDEKLRIIGQTTQQ